MGTVGGRLCKSPKGLAASARSPCNPGGLRKTVGLFRNLDPYLYLRQENRPSELSCPNAPVGFSTLSLRLFGYPSMVLIKPVAVSTISRLSLECAGGSQRSSGVTAWTWTSPFLQMLPWSWRGRTGLQRCAGCVLMRTGNLTVMALG